MSATVANRFRRRMGKMYRWTVERRVRAALLAVGACGFAALVADPLAYSAFSGRNGVIAFTLSGGDARIYTVRQDGTRLRRLTPCLPPRRLAALVVGGRALGRIRRAERRVAYPRGRAEPQTNHEARRGRPRGRRGLPRRQAADVRLPHAWLQLRHPRREPRRDGRATADA